MITIEEYLTGTKRVGPGGIIQNKKCANKMKFRNDDDL